MRGTLAAALAVAAVAGAPATAAAHAAPGSAASPAAVLPPNPLAVYALPLDPVVRLQDAAEAAPAPEGSAQRGRLEDVGRSLLIPGWGQLHAGHRTTGFIFLAAEVAIWTVFSVSVVQGELREDTYEETALRFAGIDLNAVDDEFRTLVSQYESSEEYNRLVIYRDAAALYYGDFENYNRYIEENSLAGNEAWEWSTFDKFAEYGAQRRSSEQAYHDAEFAVGLAVVNRVASAIVAARMPPVTATAPGHAEAPPASPGFSMGPRWGFEFDARGRPAPRLAWELRFP